MRLKGISATMTRETDNNLGFTIAEVMIVLAIIGIIGSFVLRVMFASGTIEWENRFWRSLGVEPELARFIIGTTAISIWGYLALKKRRRRKSNRKYEL